MQTRLKRLKRGHLVEDAAAVAAPVTGPSNRRVSMSSMSPSTPSYSTVPPPAKRHQTSHPAHTDTLPPYPPPPTTHQPSYQFHPPPTHHVSTPYHPGPHYQSPSYGPSPPVTSHSRVPSTLNEGPPNTTNGQVRSPPVAALVSTPAPTPIPAPAQTYTPKANPAPLPTSQTPLASNQLPPHQSNVTYDTRPPPPAPHPSSFAAINQAPSSGFAAINSTHSAAPVPTQAQLIKEEPSRSNPRPAEQTPIRTNSAEEKPSAGGSAANKRTPSTTHPYQMSEAFANRHHHCERTDALNRGIWTSFGPNGTKDHPTEPATEMYLVCKHDGCRRIDWRTVHGLQCHIVKNHDQPKGTIGSLEKALSRYGVPVSEIEEYERQHGPGSGGTMADPKNAKVRTKAKDFLERHDFGEREGSVPAGGPFHMQKHPSYGSDSPHMVHIPSNVSGRKRSHSFDDHAPESGSESTPVDMHKLPQARAASGFQAVNATWQGINTTPSKHPQPREWPPNQPAAPDKMSSPHLSQAPVASGAPTPFWSSWQAKNEIVPDRPTQVTHVVPSHGPPPVGLPNIHTFSTPPHVLSPPARPVDQPHSSIDNEVRSTVEDVKRDAAQEKVEVTVVSATPEAPLEMQTSEPNLQAEDTAMTDAAREQPGEPRPRPSSSGSGALKPVEILEIDTPKSEPPRDSVAVSQPEKSADHGPRTPSHEEAVSVTIEERKETRSPEASHKGIVPPKRVSRRSSMAAATLAKTSMERGRDDDVDTTYTANTTSKAESVDDDSDSITVNLVPNTDKPREKDRDSDRTKTPNRGPNGRYARNKRTR